MAARAEVKDGLRADVSLLQKVAKMQVARAHSRPQWPAVWHDPHASRLYATQQRFLDVAHRLVHGPRPAYRSRPKRPVVDHDAHYTLALLAIPPSCSIRQLQL